MGHIYCGLTCSAWSWGTGTQCSCAAPAASCCHAPAVSWSCPTWDSSWISSVYWSRTCRSHSVALSRTFPCWCPARRDRVQSPWQAELCLVEGERESGRENNEWAKLPCTVKSIEYTHRSLPCKTCSDSASWDWPCICRNLCGRKKGDFNTYSWFITALWSLLITRYFELNCNHCLLLVI